MDGFTGKYGIKRLICYEVFDEPPTAIDREKQIALEAKQEAGRSYAR
jgi:predicted GIY-YIG superfamily endonuclease